MKKILILLILLCLVGVFPSFAELTVERISGVTRHHTGLEVAKGFDSKTFIIVNEHSFADALSASALSDGKHPILLSSQQSLPDYTEAYLLEHAEAVILIGGENVLSSLLEEHLKEKGLEVTRYEGIDRYDTSLQVAKASGKKNVTLATGSGFADALSGGAISLDQDRALLLSPREDMPRAALRYLVDKDVTLLGGESVLSAELYRSVELRAQNLRRISGKNRYETSVMLAPKKPEQVIIASGENFPDALFAAPLAQCLKAPILLSKRQGLPEELRLYLENNKDSIKEIRLIGGESVLSPEVEKQIHRIFNPFSYQPNDPSLATWDGYVHPQDVTPSILETITKESLVNKFNAIAEDYVPSLAPIVTNGSSNLYLEQEAATRWNELTDLAKKEGITLVVFSAYRDKATQTRLFNGYARSNIYSAIRSSAYPRRSEHELGLAVDVSYYEGFPSNFERTLQGSFLRNNAHNYGFILRYPAGKESITGYIHEPWHYRYVGAALATKLRFEGTTLEEYYHLD